MNNFEDIPVIRRSEPIVAHVRPPALRNIRLPLILLAVGVLCTGAVLFTVPKGRPPSSVEKSVSEKSVPEKPVRAAMTSAPGAAPASLLGHNRYREVSRADLIEVDTYRGDKPVYLHRGAAPQYRALVRVARTEGIEISAISGFRSETYQEQIYTRQLGKARTVDTATLINAPPGYSEHHTGYAIDLGDGSQPGTDTQLSFERTAAFRWLVNNAGKFGFEMSFPRNNAQKVSYEPWHWRFVGNRQSVETFYQ